MRHLLKPLKTSSTKDQGFILILALAFLTILSVVGISLMQVSLQSLNTSLRHSYTQIAHTASKAAIDYAEEQYELDSAYDGTPEEDLLVNDRYRVTIEVEVLYDEGASAKRIRAYGRVYLPEAAATSDFVREIQSSIIRNGEVVGVVDPSDYDPLLWLDTDEPSSLYTTYTTPNTQYIDGLNGFSYKDLVEEKGSDAYPSYNRGVLNYYSSDWEMAWNGTGGGTTWNGIRFRGVDAPQGETIEEAYLQFTNDEAGTTGPVELEVYGVDEDDAGQWIGSYAVSGSTKTSASTVWDPPQWNVVGASSVNERVEVTDIVQEIVDRSGWTPGNAMAFAVDWNSGSGTRVAESGKDNGAPQLYIKWASGPGSTQATSDGDPVVHWLDKSLNGNDAELTFGTALSLETSELNGLDVIRSNNEGILGSFLDENLAGSEITSFIVMKPRTTSESYARFLTGQWSGHTHDSTGSNGAILAYKADGSGGSYLGQQVNGDGGQLLAGAVDGNWAVYSSKISDSFDEVLNKNGADSSSNSIVGQTFDFDEIYIGGRRTGVSSPSGTNYADYDVAEVIVYDKAMVCEDIQKIEDYLGIKYGLPIVTKSC